VRERTPQSHVNTSGCSMQTTGRSAAFSGASAQLRSRSSWKSHYGSSFSEGAGCEATDLAVQAKDLALEAEAEAETA
jgi:hypothetical protein